MISMRYARPLITVFALLLMAMAVSVAAPPPAFADRCEPSELIIRQIPGMGGYEEPLEESDKPHCTVMDRFVYPALGCDSSTTLVSCVRYVVVGTCDPTTNPCAPQVVPTLPPPLDNILP